MRIVHTDHVLQYEMYDKAHCKPYGGEVLLRPFSCVPRSLRGKADSGENFLLQHREQIF
jgi:hypothetical protein